MSNVLSDVSGSCSATCKVSVTAVLVLKSGLKPLKDFKASLLDPNEEKAAKGADGQDLAEVTAGNEAKFEKLKAGQYRARITLTDDQKKRITADSVLEKTQDVKANDDKTGMFIFQLDSFPSLKVVLFGDQAKQTKAAGIKVVAKPAGNPVNQTTNNEGAADFGFLTAGDYDLTLDLTDEQKRRFKQIPKTTIRLANNDEIVREIILDPVVKLTIKVSRQDGVKRLGNVTVKVLKAGANQGDPKVEVKSTDLNPDTTEVTHGDIDPGAYFISVLAAHNTEKSFRIGRTIARTDAALQVVQATEERDEKVNVPGQHETTVSIVLAPPYKKVQFVGYYIYTNSYTGSDVPANFGNDAYTAAEHDISSRCKIAIDAIKEAEGNADIDTHPDVLKVFMAPEFYFRGKQGAYPYETIIGRNNTPGILTRLQAETLKDAYKDWLFVLGTAVGYLDVEKKAKRVEYKVDKATLDSVLIPIVCDKSSKAAAPMASFDFFRYTEPRQQVQEVLILAVTQRTTIGNYVVLTLQIPDVPFLIGSKIEVSDGTWQAPEEVHLWADKQYTMTITCAAAVPVMGWVLQQGDAIGSILSVRNTKANTYECKIAISTGKTLKPTQPITLVDPGETEIFNIALLQKGGPTAPAAADGTRALKEALVYKETISVVDFQGPASDVPGPDGFDNKNRHLIALQGDPARRVRPTQGSTDVLGQEQNPQNTNSEVNKSGLGGGSILTIDDVDFGIEVCLDHSENRLFNYYDQRLAKKGEPKIQVHLIPSCGMTISNYCTVADGYAFNVDAANCEAHQSNGVGKIADVALKSMSAIANTGGVTISDYFKDDKVFNPAFNANVAAAPLTIQSGKGHVVIYEVVDLPAREKVP